MMVEMAIELAAAGCLQRGKRCRQPSPSLSMVTRVAMTLAQTEASDTALLCPHCKIWSRSQSMPTLLATGGTVLVLRVLDQPSADIPPHFSYPLTAVMLLYAAGVKTRDISLSSLLMRLHSRIGVLLI